MASPVSAEDVAPYLISPESSPCDKATSAAQTTRIFHQFLAYLEEIGVIDENGEWTGTVGGGTGGSSSIAAPSGVAATSDRSTDVKVTWGSVTGATSYLVFRGTSSDTASMSLLATVSVAEHLDTTAVVGTVYFYAVKASSPSLNSGFSAVASGSRVAGAGFTPIITDNANSATEVTVPDGATVMTVEMWGSGGVGGGASSVGWISPAPGYTSAGGGGGASGSYHKITGIAVSSGEKWYLLPGRNGGASTIYKGSVGAALYATATPGNPGGNSTFNTAVGIGGLPASSYGSNSLSLGSSDGSSHVGNAGGNGTLSPGGGVPGTGGAGGAVYEVGGRGGGAGGVGTIVATGGTPQNGLIVVEFA